jgi:hypothetical protein
MVDLERTKPLLGVLAFCAGLGWPGIVGAAEVVALSGEAWVEEATGRRALACGDLVADGERVVVSPEGSLGLLSVASYAQLEPGSTARFALTVAGAASIDLEAGRMRLVDTGNDPEAPLQRLTAPGVEAHGRGGDTEIYILDEKTDRYAMLCEWAEPILVARPGAPDVTLRAEPGACAVAKADEPIYKTRAHDERIPLALAGPDAASPGPRRDPRAPGGPGTCPTGEMPGSLAADRLSPTDVAAAPPPTGLLAPAPPAFNREPHFGLGSAGGGRAVVDSPFTPGVRPVP